MLPNPTDKYRLDNYVKSGTRNVTGIGIDMIISEWFPLHLRFFIICPNFVIYM